MPKFDKSAIRPGAFLTGGAFPGSLVSVADDTGRSRPVAYGRQPPPAPALSEIGERMDRLREKVEQVAATLRKARQR